MRPSTLVAVATLAVSVAAAPSSLSAQTITADGPVVYGHHHFNTTDMAAQKRFFVETLGGKLATIGTNNLEVIEFPNVFLFFRPMQAPTGGTIGTTVNHVGFSVPDLKPVVAKLKANGFKMITSDSVAATVKVPPVAVNAPLSMWKAPVEPSLKSAERSTSRRPPGMLPGCGSVGPPVCCCQ